MPDVHPVHRRAPILPNHLVVPVPRDQSPPRDPLGVPRALQPGLEPEALVHARAQGRLDAVAREDDVDLERGEGRVGKGERDAMRGREVRGDAVVEAGDARRELGGELVEEVGAASGAGE